jgi:hypothetical protein
VRGHIGFMVRFENTCRAVNRKIEGKKRIWAARKKRRRPPTCGGGHRRDHDGLMGNR